MRRGSTTFRRARGFTGFGVLPSPKSLSSPAFTTEIDTAEVEAEEDLQAVEAHVFGEIRDLQDRLRELEGAVKRMTRRPTA